MYVLGVGSGALLDSWELTGWGLLSEGGTTW